MHCDVDLRSRRMWAASYRLTRLEMNESSELLESFCTGHARVRAERGGDGGDGAVADAPVLGRRCCCGCAASLGGRGCVPGGVVRLGSPGRGVRPHTKRSKIGDRVPVHVGTWYAFTAM